MADMNRWPWKEVFLARHGETVWNREKRRQGRLDSPLTEAGIENAEQVAELVAGMAPDRLYSSPLGRARATAEIVGRRLGIPATVVDDLAEIDHGEVGGLTNAEIEELFPGLAERRRADKYRFRFPGGESYADADVRARRSWGAVHGARPLIVTHEMVGRMLIRNLLGIEPAEALRWNHPHGTVLRFDMVTRRVVLVSSEGSREVFAYGATILSRASN
ncbi:broad specificity phosphatase PhoE [Nocardioides zeae]|nr:broad specificity phosphatase PhoE [Nocardioides zeae]